MTKTVCTGIAPFCFVFQLHWELIFKLRGLWLWTMSCYVGGATPFLTGKFKIKSSLYFPRLLVWLLCVVTHTTFIPLWFPHSPAFCVDTVWSNPYCMTVTLASSRMNASWEKAFSSPQGVCVTLQLWTLFWMSTINRSKCLLSRFWILRQQQTRQ